MPAPERGHGYAPARAALVGNPSDGYGGAVLAVTLPLWRAQAWAEPGAGPAVNPPSRLVQATVGRFADRLDPRAAASALSWETTIPRGVGLGGSSAIVIGVTRALCHALRVDLDPADLAHFALAVETEELGIAAGLQDRVTQAYGGAVFMDVATTPAVYERLEVTVPRLLIAWDPETGGESGHVHEKLQLRHQQGEPGVVERMRDLAAVARRGRSALLASRTDELCACLDRTFDLRHELIELDSRCVEMVMAARRAGASANYTGSGGAVVVASPRRAPVEAAARSLAAAGRRTALVSPG